MAENLIWSVNESYPEQKIIVWAHSLHVARSVPSVASVNPPRKRYMDFIGMGDYVHHEVGKSAYSVAFVTYQGTRGRRENHPPGRVESVTGSLQSLWHHTGYFLSFLDLRSVPGGHWLYGPLQAYVSGSPNQRAIWPNVFDGFFYIDTMFPYKPLEKIPEGIHTKEQ